MTTIPVNRENCRVDEFKAVENFPFLVKINKSYLNLSPDINHLVRILKIVASQVVLCPDNGNFRCVAMLSTGGGQAGMFFPMILPEVEARHQKMITVGTIGDVLSSEMLVFCKETHVVFRECCLFRKA